MKKRMIKLKEIKYQFATGAPQLPGTYKFTNNCERLIIFLGRENPSMYSERSKDVISIDVDETKYVGFTERSDGYRRKKDLVVLSKSWNSKLEKFKRNPKFKLKKIGSSSSFLRWNCYIAGITKIATISKIYGEYKANFIPSNETDIFKKRKDAVSWLQSKFNEFVS